MQWNIAIKQSRYGLLIILFECIYIVYNIFQ